MIKIYIFGRKLRGIFDLLISVPDHDQEPRPHSHPDVLHSKYQSNAEFLVLEDVITFNVMSVFSAFAEGYTLSRDYLNASDAYNVEKLRHEKRSQEIH